MATLLVNDESYDVPDGSKLRDLETDINFGCKQGMCQTCLIEVVEGMENLNEKTDAEEMHNLRDDQRLACQTIIEEGAVEVEHV